MAGLTLDDSVNPAAEVVKLANGNASVSASLTDGDWSTYSVRPAEDAGWAIFGPAGTAASVSGDPSTPENKTFVPDLPGRYKIVFEGYDGDDQVQLSGLYEVRSTVSSESLPAPRETNEYHAQEGWFRSIEARLKQAGLQLRGGARICSVHNSGVAALAAGTPVVLGSYARWYQAGAAGQPALDQPGVLGVAAQELFFTPMATDIVAITMEEVAAGGVGLALVDGLVPFDTSGFMAYNDLYIDDVGALSTTPGFTVRKVGRTLASGPANSDSPSPGAIYFNGFPSYNTLLSDQDYVTAERTLFAGMQALAAGGQEVVGMDYMQPANTLNPFLSSASRIQLQSVFFRVSGYVTDVSEPYYVELYDDSEQQLISSVFVGTDSLWVYQGFITLGTGVGEMAPDSARPYSVRVRSSSGSLDESKKLVLTNAAIVCIGGF